MVLLLGGTTEGKETASFLDELGVTYIYSTRSEVSFEGKGIYRHGPLDKERLRHLCISEHVSHIIDACHPFAEVLHLTVEALAGEFPLIRLEREHPERSAHPLVSYVNDFTGALKLIATKSYSSMIALTGVQSIPKLSGFWLQHQCWIRILDKKCSITTAAIYHFPAENLLLGMPQNREAEIELFSRLRPAVVLSKENGSNGKIEAKIAAAVACDIPIIIVKKPELSPVFKVVYNRKELLSELKNV